MFRKFESGMCELSWESKESSEFKRIWMNFTFVTLNIICYTKYVQFERENDVSKYFFVSIFIQEFQLVSSPVFCWVLRTQLDRTTLTLNTHQFDYLKRFHPVTNWLNWQHNLVEYGICWDLRVAPYLVLIVFCFVLGFGCKECKSKGWSACACACRCLGL